jgi:hypothetical protein
MGHAVWNLFASIAITVLSIGLERVFLFPDWQALLIGGLIGGLPFSLPPLLLAIVIALLGRDQEARIIREYLPIEVSLGTLSADECRVVSDPAARKESLLSAQLSGGSKRRKQQRAFNDLATRLAFFHYHAIKGERPYQPEIKRAAQLRWNLSALRWSMRNAPEST